MSENISSWLGQCRVKEGETRRWRVGPLTLWIQRLEGEWRIAHESNQNATDDAVEYGTVVCDLDIIQHPTATRFGVVGSSEVVTVLPALADRPVVSSPEQSLVIPAGEDVTVYVGSPLWLRVLEGEHQNFLVELPIHQPADTWFGANTQVGQLCYASRSFCRLRSRLLQNFPHRAHSAVRVQNQAATLLRLERMLIPVPTLSLYRHASTGVLWTEDVVLQRHVDDELALFKIMRGAPEAASGAPLVTEARDKRSSNVMVRAFASLFSS